MGVFARKIGDKWLRVYLSDQSRSLRGEKCNKGRESYQWINRYLCMIMLGTSS